MPKKIILTESKNEFLINNVDKTLKEIANMLGCCQATAHVLITEQNNSRLVFVEKPIKKRPPSEYSNHVSLYPELGYRGGLGV